MKNEFDGLSVRGFGILMLLGFKKKAEVVQVLKDDPFRIKEAPCCGPARWKDICDWAGIPDATPPQRKKRPSENAIGSAIRLLEENGYVVQTKTKSNP